MLTHKVILSAVFSALLFCIAGAAYGEVFAKQKLAEELYGQGVHAFFENDYQGSVDLLSRAEKLGSSDPRVYFFLALSHLRLNKRGNADTYFKEAAKLEQEGQSARDYRISAAISRIQGFERLLVEGYRRQARQNWEKAEKKRREVMYASEKAKEEKILKNISKAPVAVAPFGARSLDPFAKPEKESTKPEEPAKKN